MRRVRTCVVAFVFALSSALAAAGCGGDDEPEGDGARTVRTQPAATTAETKRPEGAGESTTGHTAESSATASALPDPCELLSASEIREAARLDVVGQEERGDTVDGFKYRECSWTAIGHEDSAAVRVVSSPKRYDSLLNSLKGARAPITKLDGLGDAAFLSPGFSGETAGGTRGSTVFVKAGGRTLTLAFANAKDDGPRDQVVALMEKMLSSAR